MWTLHAMGGLSKLEGVERRGETPAGRKANALKRDQPEAVASDDAATRADPR